MASRFSIKGSTQSLSGKLLLGLLLACVVVAASWAITNITFRQMLDKVNNLSTPNPKLQLVNRIFRHAVQLEQLQRAQSIQTNKKKHNAFFDESKRLREMLDSLQNISYADTQDLNRIQAMKDLLWQRDELYLNYLTMRTEYINNDTLNAKLKSLTKLLNSPEYSDSNVVKTESKKITTTTIVPADDIRKENKSLWDRVFGRKKNAEEEKPQQVIKEEVNITTDTVKMTARDSSLLKLSETIANAEVSRLNKRNELINRQAQLNQAGNVFIGQLLDILYEVEQEEILLSQYSNEAATKIMNRNLWRLNIVIIAFIVAAALLAFFIIIDITDSNRYKTALIAAKEEAEELGMVKQRFLANMSHELRTPLQAIVGMAEQVNQKKNATEKEINLIYQSSQHLLQIVNEVLDYSRITSGKFKLDEKQFNLRNLLDEVKNVMLIKASEKSLQLNYEPRINEKINHIGDPFRLKQILYNLLGNAIKFTNSGHVTLKVEEKDFSAYSMFTFTVSDTGKGIEHDDLERIFNQFEQGINTTAQQGTGLGLSIVQSLVETMKGTIKVTSTPGVGSTLTVTIPYTISKTDEEAALIKGVIAASEIKQEVWVVDDDPMILLLCHHILEKNNIRHRYFGNPEAILAAFEDNCPDIVLMDIRMPGMTGFELLQKIKPMLKPHTHVYALTAHALPEDREDILRPGFNNLLMKPFLEHELLSLITGVSHTPTTSPPETKDKWSEMKDMVGDEELFFQILSGFIKETEEDKKLLRKAVEDNSALAAEHLHKLAGRCSQVGFKELGTKLRATELLIRNGHLENNIPAVYNLISEVTDAVTEAKEYLNTHTA